MALSRLREILTTQIDGYLANDNPPPADNKLTTRFAGVFKHSGGEGRKRAALYRAQITSTVDDDNFLASRVMDDIKNGNTSSALGTSSVLRTRLLEGLSAFYVISADAINHTAKQLQRDDMAAARFAASPFAGAPLVRSQDTLYRVAMISLVSQAIEQKIAGNRLARAISDNSL